MEPSIQIVILAGGLGTRLLPLTEKIPKAMISILGKPFIHYQLKWLAKNEIRDIILSTGYLGEQIQDFIQDGSSWGVKVQYVQEGKNLLGTGGALRLVCEQAKLQEKFLVTYGDSYLPVDFKKIWENFLNQTEPALMTVIKNNEKWDASNACFKEGKITLYDKKAAILESKPDEMKYIDYGLSGWNKNIIQKKIPCNRKVDLADVFHELSIQGLLKGYEITQRFYEIGSIQGIQDLETFLA